MLMLVDGRLLNPTGEVFDRLWSRNNGKTDDSYIFWTLRTIVGHEVTSGLNKSYILQQFKYFNFQPISRIFISKIYVYISSFRHSCLLKKSHISFH